MDSAKKSMHDVYAEIESKHLSERAQIMDAFISDLGKKHHAQIARKSLSGSAPEMLVEDQYDGSTRRMIYFGSNDYLNLTKHPRLKRAAIDAIEQYGTGAGSVPLLGGTFDIQTSLEEELAEFKGCESAMVFTSGFVSNYGALSALLGPADCAIADKLIHASLMDGCRNTNVAKFRHNDMESLEETLKACREKYKTKIVIVDGVYSMDGDIAHLNVIVDLAHRYDAMVMVDEAHATGVIGKEGRGTPEHFVIEGSVDIVAGTLSKAMGAVGGFIASSKRIIQYLRYSSRPYIFSTAMVPSATAASREALKVIVEEPELRIKLWENINYLRSRLENFGFNLHGSQSAIFPIIIGDDFIVKEMCRKLHENNIYVNQVSFPAVSVRMSRLRISLTAGHTLEHLDLLADNLAELGKEYGII